MPSVDMTSKNNNVEAVRRTSRRHNFDCEEEGIHVNAQVSGLNEARRHNVGRGEAQENNMDIHVIDCSCRMPLCSKLMPTESLIPAYAFHGDELPAFEGPISAAEGGGEPLNSAFTALRRCQDKRQVSFFYTF